MNEAINLSDTKLTAEDQKAVTEFCDAIGGDSALGARSFILYGSAVRGNYRPGQSDVNVLVVLERIDVAVLKKTLEPTFRARQKGIAPFFITLENLQTSADVFPIKFLSIQESCRTLRGSDVMKELHIKREHLRLRLEQELKNLLLRLVRSYVVNGGTDLAAIMRKTISGFMENLRVALALAKESALPSRSEVAQKSAETFGLDFDVLCELQALRRSDVPLTAQESERLYDAYLKAVDIMALAADRMQ